jgi:uncharacterized protein involved in response to NO
MVTPAPSEPRTTRASALFEYGYRAFFLLATLHGAVLVPVWVAALFGWLALPVEMEFSGTRIRWSTALLRPGLPGSC